jgi:hypothetical protein
MEISLQMTTCKTYCQAITNNFVIGAPKQSNFQGKNIIKSLKVIQNLCDQIWTTIPHQYISY